MRDCAWMNISGPSVKWNGKQLIPESWVDAATLKVSARFVEEAMDG
jgi:hypothetical protein